jgi:TolA-binding protein/thioredoxin-like negative regulator of GroEL
MRKITLFMAAVVMMIAVGVEVTAQTTPEDLFQEAERRLAAEDYPLALNLYARIVDQYPTSRFALEARYKKGIVLTKTGRYKEALEVFTPLSRRRTGGQFAEPSVFWAGMCFYELGDYAEAASRFAGYLAGRDRRYREKALLYRGLALGRNGDVDEALEILGRSYDEPGRAGTETEGFLFYCALLLEEEEYEELLRVVRSGEPAIDSREEKLHLSLFEAEALWGLDRRDRAEELYRDLLDADQAAASVAVQRLFVYYLEGGMDEKLENLVVTAESRLSDKPEVLAKLWTRMGIRYFEEGQYDLSSSYFQRAWLTREESKIPEAVPVYLAEIYLAQDKPSRAEEILTAFIEENPDRSEQSMIKLGHVYILAERWKEAESSFLELLGRDLSPAVEGELTYQLAYTRWKLESPAAALESLEDILGATTSESLAAKALRLRSMVLYSEERYPEAEDALEDFLDFRPDDVEATLDLMKIYFLRGEYRRVIDGVQALYETSPDLEEENPRQELLARYLLGIASIPGREYSRAIDILEGIDEAEAREIPDIFPSVLFYRGWAYYRLGRYGEALEYFDRLITEHPTHELTDRSVYFAGWCDYTRERYAPAAERFRWFFRDTAPRDLREKGIFMLGKSLFNDLDFEEAALIFQKLFVDFPDSPLADDALFEYADSLLRLGDVEESINSYERLSRSYPNSSLVEEAMYRRGEILYSEERFIPARDAFYEYRTSFPRGELADAALYWGGMAYSRTDEPYGALLLWERLIDSFPESTFRPDAIAESAALYERTGDYRKAMDLYNLLLASYPAEAESVGARRKLNELEHLLGGKTEREAELAATIGSEGGAATDLGREAMIELSRIYIYKDRSRAEVRRAVDMLERVLDRRSEDPRAAAEAKYLMGEYHFRQGDLAAAGQSFLQAATIYPRDRDLLAESIYRAAEMTLLAGNLGEARTLVERLETNFPDSQWAVEGRMLLREGVRR